MIYVNKQGNIVINSNESHQGIERILEYQKALLHLIQNQNQDFFDQEMHWVACELLSNLLFDESRCSPNRINAALKEAM